jgi:hypothetical protein
MILISFPLTRHARYLAELAAMIGAAYSACNFVSVSFSFASWFLVVHRVQVENISTRDDAVQHLEGTKMRERMMLHSGEENEGESKNRRWIKGIISLLHFMSFFVLFNFHLLFVFG